MTEKSIDLIVDVGREYSSRLTDRTYEQSANPCNAYHFRQRYLPPPDSLDAWERAASTIEPAFSGVRNIGPGFADEAFAYFVRYVSSPDDIFDRIRISNVSSVKLAIIRNEVCAAFGVDRSG